MGSTLTLLVVDDNDVDAERVERGVRRLGLETPIVRAADGLEAIECLRGTGERPAATPPRLVLLDLNMPRMSGAEFLEYVRQDDELKDLPVFVVTTSARPADIECAQSYGAIDYFVKPLRDEQLLELISRVNGSGQAP